MLDKNIESKYNGSELSYGQSNHFRYYSDLLAAAILAKSLSEEDVRDISVCAIEKSKWLLLEHPDRKVLWRESLRKVVDMTRATYNESHCDIIRRTTDTAEHFSNNKNGIQAVILWHFL